MDLWDQPKPPLATWNWNAPDSYDWYLAAQVAGNAVLAVNPQWLIFVAGLGTDGWPGSDLTYAQSSPVVLSRPNQLVYSTHEFSQDAYNQSWFSAPNYPNNLRDLWRSRWGYLEEKGQTPVFATFGTFFTYPINDGKWLTKLINYINGEFTKDSVSDLRPGQMGMSWAVGLQGMGILYGDFKTIDTSTLNFLPKSQAPLLSGPLPSAEPSTPPTFAPSAKPTTGSPTLPQPTYTSTFRPTNVLAGSKYFEKYFAQGNQIVDESGNPIRMTGVNWLNRLFN